jgi:type II secretory pathway pseudopilin PulG
MLREMAPPNLADDDTLIRPRVRAQASPFPDPSEVITDKTRLPGNAQPGGADPFEHEAIRDPAFPPAEPGWPPPELVREQAPEQAPEPAWAAESPWRLNFLGALLLIALVVAVSAVIALRVQLSRARADAAEAMENLAQLDEKLLEVSRSAARAPAPSGQAAEQPADRAGGAAGQAPEPALEPNSEPSSEPNSERPPERPPEQAGPQVRSSSQLQVLLTVGTRPFAERQLRRLRRRCGPSLGIYRQKRGRCAFSECWVLAAPADEPARAPACGPAKGKALRDRSDFVAQL